MTQFFDKVNGRMLPTYPTGAYPTNVEEGCLITDSVTGKTMRYDGSTWSEFGASGGSGIPEIRNTVYIDSGAATDASRHLYRTIKEAVAAEGYYGIEFVLISSDSSRLSSIGTGDPIEFKSCTFRPKPGATTAFVNINCDAALHVAFTACSFLNIEIKHLDAADTNYSRTTEFYGCVGSVSIRFDYASQYLDLTIDIQQCVLTKLGTSVKATSPTSEIATITIKDSTVAIPDTSFSCGVLALTDSDIIGSPRMWIAQLTLEGKTSGSADRLYSIDMRHGAPSDGSLVRVYEGAHIDWRIKELAFESASSRAISSYVRFDGTSGNEVTGALLIDNVVQRSLDTTSFPNADSAFTIVQVDGEAPKDFTFHCELDPTSSPLESDIFNRNLASPPALFGEFGVNSKVYVLCGTVHQYVNASSHMSFSSFIPSVGLGSTVTVPLIDIRLHLPSAGIGSAVVIASEEGEGICTIEKLKISNNSIANASQELRFVTGIADMRIHSVEILDTSGGQTHAPGNICGISFTGDTITALIADYYGYNTATRGSTFIELDGVGNTLKSVGSFTFRGTRVVNTSYIETSPEVILTATTRGVVFTASLIYKVTIAGNENVMLLNSGANSATVTVTGSDNRRVDTSSI